jgi:signal transduction histidine kinase
VAALQPGRRLRTTCRSADGSLRFEAIAVADGESVCLTPKDATEQARTVSRLEAELDILDLATIEAGLISLEIESVDVHGILVGMLNLVQESARKQRLELLLDCPHSIGRIDADERRLKQVLFNLLSNALKLTPEGGRVTLGARRHEKTLTIWVADTGVGIERDEQKSVFDKFHRGIQPLARQSGAGLGLSPVRYFVELHGGELTLQSQPDVGTTVTRILPLEPPRDVEVFSPFGR